MIFVNGHRTQGEDAALLFDLLAGAVVGNMPADSWTFGTPRYSCAYSMETQKYQDVSTR